MRKDKNDLKVSWQTEWPLGIGRKVYKVEDRGKTAKPGLGWTPEEAVSKWEDKNIKK